jgi:hypothetical protein
MNVARLVVVPSASVFTVSNYCWNWYLRMKADVTSLKLPRFSFLTTVSFNAMESILTLRSRWLL